MILNGLYLYIFKYREKYSEQNKASHNNPKTNHRLNGKKRRNKPNKTTTQKNKSKLAVKFIKDVNRDVNYILFFPHGQNYHLRIDERYSNTQKFLSAVHFTNNATGLHIYFDTHGAIKEINNTDAFLSDGDIKSDIIVATELYKGMISEIHEEISIKQDKLKEFIARSEVGAKVSADAFKEINGIIDDLKQYYPYKANYFNFINKILNMVHSPKAQELPKLMPDASTQEETKEQAEHCDAGTLQVEESKTPNYSDLIKEEITKLIAEMNALIKENDLKGLSNNMSLLHEMRTIHDHPSLTPIWEAANNFIKREFTKYDLSSIETIFSADPTVIPRECFKDFLSKILTSENTDQDILLLKYLFENSAIFKEELYKYEDYYLLELYKHDKFSAFQGLLESGYDANHVVNEQLLMTALIKNNHDDTLHLKPYLDSLVSFKANMNKDIRSSYFRGIIKAHQQISRAGVRSDQVALIKSEYEDFIATNPVFVALQDCRYDLVEQLMPHLNFENLLCLLSNVVSSKSVILRKIYEYSGSVINFAMNDEESMAVMFDRNFMPKGIKYKTPCCITLMPNPDPAKKKEESFYQLISKVVDEVNRCVAEGIDTSIISKLFDKYKNAMLIAAVSNNNYSDHANRKMLLFCSLFDLAINGNEKDLTKYIKLCLEDSEKARFPCTSDFIKKAPNTLLAMSTIVEVPDHAAVSFIALNSMIVVLKSSKRNDEISYINLNNDSNFSHVSNYLQGKLTSGEKYTASIHLVNSATNPEDWAESRSFLESILTNFEIKIIYNEVIKAHSANKFGIFKGGDLILPLKDLSQEGFSRIMKHYLMLLSFYIQYDPLPEFGLQKINTGIPVYNLANIRKDLTDFLKAARAYDLNEIQRLLINTHVAKLTSFRESNLLSVVFIQEIVNKMVASINTITDFFDTLDLLRNLKVEKIRPVIEARLTKLRDKLAFCSSTSELKESDEDNAASRLKNIMSCLKILALHGSALPKGINSKPINWYFQVLLKSVLSPGVNTFATSVALASRGICQKLSPFVFKCGSGEMESKIVSARAILDFSDILLSQTKQVKDDVIGIMPSGQLPLIGVIGNLKQINGTKAFNDTVLDIDLYSQVHNEYK